VKMHSTPVILTSDVVEQGHEAIIHVQLLMAME
jgi:hypothetical protein